MEQKSTVPPKWDWIPCNYNLKTEIKKKVVVWNLQPAIVLTNPNEDGLDPHVKLYIDTEKSLQYSDELGWNWHKSWNLPNISVRLEIKDATNGETLLSPKNLYAHIFAVKAIIDQPDNFHLVDVGIRGNNKLEMVNGQAFFTAIKFFSTSYNNEGVKFHLVLCIYIQNEEDEVPKILNATISPPIFVDSRKSARDQQVILEKKMTSFVEPFLPENLDKAYIKRENKKKCDTEIKILNNVEGLFNYLTAPNIRHKVKHPLFLCLKFSLCVKLYFNKNFMPGLKTDQLLETLQKKLTKEHCTTKIQPNSTAKLDDKYFILFVEESPDNYKNKKVIEAIEPLQCPTLGIIYQLNLLPPAFENICGEGENVTELISTYRKCYSNLVSVVKMIRTNEAEEQDDDDDDDEDSNSEDEESISSSSENGEVSAKKVKLNPQSNSEKNLESLSDKVNNNRKDSVSSEREGSCEQQPKSQSENKDKNLSTPIKQNNTAQKVQNQASAQSQFQQQQNSAQQQQQPQLDGQNGIDSNHVDQQPPHQGQMPANMMDPRMSMMFTPYYQQQMNGLNQQQQQMVLKMLMKGNQPPQQQLQGQQAAATQNPATQQQSQQAQEQQQQQPQQQNSNNQTQNVQSQITGNQTSQIKKENNPQQQITPQMQQQIQSPSQQQQHQQQTNQQMQQQNIMNMWNMKNQMMSPQQVGQQGQNPMSQMPLGMGLGQVNPMNYAQMFMNPNINMGMSGINQIGALPQQMNNYMHMVQNYQMGQNFGQPFQMNMPLNPMQFQNNEQYMLMSKGIFSNMMKQGNSQQTQPQQPPQFWGGQNMNFQQDNTQNVSQAQQMDDGNSNNNNTNQRENQQSEEAIKNNKNLTNNGQEVKKEELPNNQIHQLQ